MPCFRGIAVHCRIVVSDRFAILEWVSSSNSGIVATFVLKNLKKTVQKWQEKQRNAGFRIKASVEELETGTTRGLSSAVAAELAAGAYIRDGRTVIITRTTGTGKSYLACALGDTACRQGIKTLYFTMNTLLENLRLVHACN